MDTIQAINDEKIKFDGVLPQRRFKHRVLLVEDSPESENFIRRVCETVDGDMRLKCVSTAEEAQRILQSNANYDLIIADHYLAGKATGLDLWKECRARFKQIPFMMTSSLTNEEFLDEIGDNWNYPLFLHKPLNKKSCQEMIEWYLEIFPKRPAIQRPPHFENIFRGLMGTIGFLAFTILLLTPHELETAGALFSKNWNWKVPRSDRPLKRNINEDIKVPPLPPGQPLELRDLFTPDITWRMASKIIR